MKKFTAVMAVVMVLSVALLAATPASAAPQQVATKAPAAAVMGLLERVMMLLGLRTASQVPVNGSPTVAPATPTTDGAIWGNGRGWCGSSPC